MPTRAVGLILFVLLPFVEVTSGKAARDAHKHHHHTADSPATDRSSEFGSGNKEKVIDGGINPKDTKHYDGDGRHNIDFDHEAILGSQKDVEDFENLTPMQAQTKLLDIITKMDVNGDRWIEQEELTSWIHKSFISLSEEEARERFSESDDDDDGFVTWLEYRGEVFGIYSDADLPQTDDEGYEDTTKWLAEDEEVFRLCDVDEDGRLSPQEFYVFSYPEEQRLTSPHIYQLVLTRALQEKDTNGDGKITLEEFLGDRHPTDDNEWYESEKVRFSTEYDFDGNGMLEGSLELGKWLVPGNQELSEEESSHLMSIADDDKDGRLSREEIMSHWKTFVTSSGDDMDDDDDDEDEDDELFNRDEL